MMARNSALRCLLETARGDSDGRWGESREDSSMKDVKKIWHGGWQQFKMTSQETVKGDSVEMKAK